jgi:hypothetical protein
MTPVSPGLRSRRPVQDGDGHGGAVPAGAGTTTVRTGVRMPRMNALMQRGVRSCRYELPGRTLIWNQHHLLRALRESGASCNHHRPRQGIANARPPRPLPPPITDPGQIAHIDIRRHQRLSEIPNEYDHAAGAARMRLPARTALAGKAATRIPMPATAVARSALVAFRTRTSTARTFGATGW